MNDTLSNRAAQLFPLHPKYQEAWVRIVTLLGDKWLLAKKVQRGNK